MAPGAIPPRDGNFTEDPVRRREKSSGAGERHKSARSGACAPVEPSLSTARHDAVSVGDVQRCAKKYLWDKDIAVAAVGRTEGLMDYSRMRSGMTSLLW
ncbi:uncharacterized protein RHOBADRAFT_46789 [Rhodotorula graminis WP1]|uniref:Uncharacterized protein n=1 Tax=Rhodotorula graminis (strain WP1) TaxID=578459 RepID=A0A0P9EKW2_RHOGW|nr:uncharacterized protein RHOBADRAFT_46789 [Rhodotorula graminis WP1]KPV72336.1 hypothetical protein RHOBADRAFT_46789 [Rhodotorula graminis WP1]